MSNISRKLIPNESIKYTDTKSKNMCLRNMFLACLPYEIRQSKCYAEFHDKDL